MFYSISEFETFIKRDLISNIDEFLSQEKNFNYVCMYLLNDSEEFRKFFTSIVPRAFLDMKLYKHFRDNVNPRIFNYINMDRDRITKPICTWINTHYDLKWFNDVFGSGEKIVLTRNLEGLSIKLSAITDYNALFQCINNSKNKCIFKGLTVTPVNDGWIVFFY